MGYTTTFIGKIKFDRPLDAEDSWEISDYIADSGDNIDWEVCDGGQALRWNGMEKSYFMPEKLENLIHKFFVPMGYALNGKMLAQGESPGDVWKLIVKDNVVSREDIAREFLEDIDE